MKKLSIAVILFLTVIGRTFASDVPNHTDPSFKGADHFKTHFPGATDVDCKVTGQFTKVNFTWNTLKLEAFYDMDGNPIATCRQIPVNNLPLPLQMSLKKNYPDFIAIDATEFDAVDDGLCYYVSITNDQVTYVLHIDVNGSTYVFKKMKN